MIARLADAEANNSAQTQFVPHSWPMPQSAVFTAPPAPYVVLHVGARNPLRRWLPDRWRTLADALYARGYTVAWSGGPDDTDAIAQVAPQPHEHNLCGALDLAQLWHLLKGASLLISTDTGSPHLARTASCANVVLFGPGSATMSGSPAFFAAIPSAAVGAPTFPCRDQHVAFKRETPGMARCVRFAPDCVDNRCMQVIAADAVLTAALGLLDTAAAR